MRRRLPRRQRRRIVLPKKLIAVVLILIGIIGTLVAISRIFTIKEISCQSQYGPCSDYIVNQIRQASGKHYLAAKREIDTLLQKGMMVRGYSIRMISPNTIGITVVERKAIAAVAREGKLDELFLVDSEGYVISQISTTNLPILILKTPQEPQIGQITTSEILFGTKILHQLSIIYTVKVAYMEQESISMTLPNNMTVLFPHEGDQDVLLGTLSLILSRLNTASHGTTINEGGVVPKIIDLRFKNPLLK